MGEVDPAVVGARVRDRRTALGLSQEELAARAGISRQALGALETGRHLPRADAAVALAQRLGTTVEALLSGPSVLPRHVFFGSLGDGEPVRVGRVGERTVCVPIPATGDGERWDAPDGIVRGGMVDLLPDGETEGFVMVGCDPAIGVLAGLGPRRGAARIVPATACTTQAQRALAAGRAHAAVVHGPATLPTGGGSARPGDGPAERLPLARWRVGIAATSEPVVDAAMLGLGRVLQADRGSAAQLAYERALAAVDAAPPPGTRSAGHVEAARRAAAEGLAAVTIEPAARALGLAFRPLESHVVEVHLGPDALDHAGAAIVRELVASARFRRRIAALPGYAAA